MRRWVWLAMVGAALGTAVVVGLSLTHMTASAAACTDTWVGGVDNNFGTAGNWSTSLVPTASDDACITATTSTVPASVADTYTVLLNGTFTLHSLAIGGPNGTQTLIVPSGQQLTLAAASVVNTNGVLSLGDSGNAVTALSAAGVNVTNAGHLNTVQGGGGNRDLRANITNTGTIDIGASQTLLDVAGSSIINNSTVTIEASGGLGMSGGSAFSNNGGAVTNNGAFSVTGASFIQRGGTESVTPVYFFNGSTLDDDLGAGAGLFTILNSSAVLTGTGPNPGIAAGQVVSIGAGSGTQLTLGLSLTNAGTLVMGDAGAGYSILCCNTQTLTNTGHLNTIQGGGGARYLRANLVNAASGSIDIAAANSFQDGGGGATTTTNNGALTIELGGSYRVASASTFTQAPSGMFATTINANTISFGRLTGGTVHLDGRLMVTTIGSPMVGSTWPIISAGSRSGQFAAFSICSPSYDVQYSATDVTLVIHATMMSAAQTTQYSLTGSDGVIWQDMDATNLTLLITPAADSYAILGGNSDLWTASAGYNQDLGLRVSGGAYPTVAGQPEAWKESGGFAGTFSPNAAFVQTVVSLRQGVTYTVRLVWKANKNAPGASIFAGAGPISGQFSPTRLSAQLVPASSSNLKSAAVNGQMAQSGSDGATWTDLNAGLSFQYTPCANGFVVLSGNADLWTSSAGYNQDLGITVSGGAYPTAAGQPEAWKESGGFAGTFSPNAANVQTVIPVVAGTPYAIKLQWKANMASPPTATIFAGAGPIGGQYSATRLTLEFVPSGGSSAGVLDAASTTQHSLSASDGATWVDLDPTSTISFTSTTSCVALVSANADLWTSAAGYNQDIAISVNGTVMAWKESGGFAGTFSPNAAYVQTVVAIAPATSYSVKMRWKTNRPSPSTAAIFAGAGPLNSKYSPTRLTVRLLGCT